MLFIMISSTLFYIWTTPHKISYLWVAYNWSIVIGNKISPPSLEKSLCLFLSSSYRTWKSRTFVQSILGICQRESQTVHQILSDFSPMGIANYRDGTKRIFFLPPSCPPALLPSCPPALLNRLSWKQKCRNKRLWAPRLWCSIYNFLFCLCWPQTLLFNFI